MFGERGIDMSDVTSWEDEGGLTEEEDENLSGDRHPRRPQYPPRPESAELELEETEENLELAGFRA